LIEAQNRANVNTIFAYAEKLSVKETNKKLGLAITRVKIFFSELVYRKDLLSDFVAASVRDNFLVLLQFLCKAT
jgi:hypothetical protein